jgi:hypothetical protein
MTPKQEKIAVEVTAIVKVHGDSPIYFLQHDNLMIQTPSFSAFQTPEFGIEEDLLEYEKKVKLFEFSELSEEAKQKAFNKIIKL